jgi:hypothetical protein
MVDNLLTMARTVQQFMPSEPLFWLAVGAFAGLIALVAIMNPVDTSDAPAEQAHAKHDTAR